MAQTKTHHIPPRDGPTTPVPVPAIEGIEITDTTPGATVAALLAPDRCRAFLVDARDLEAGAGDPGYRAALCGADMVLPDASARPARGAKDDRPAGGALLPLLLSQAAQRRKSVFLFGGAPGTAEAAALAMMLKTPGLRIAGTRDGHAGAADPDAAVARINASGADILLVSMDSPAQEKWLDRHGPLIEANLQMGVGAAVQTFVGYVLRSPRLLGTAAGRGRDAEADGVSYPFG